MVENLLNLTRIQEGRLDINKKKEVVDDLVASAVRLVSNRVGNHTLKMETPEDILWYLWTGDCSSRFWSIFWTMRSAIPGPAPR